MSAHDQRGTRRLRLVPLRGGDAQATGASERPQDTAQVGGAAVDSSVHPALERQDVGDASSTPVPASTSFPAERAWTATGRDEQRSARPAARTGPLGDLPDGQLVALAATGDRRAFETLYRRHVAFALHLATRIEGSSRDVEDVVHDAFLRAFERLADLADRNAFRAWLGAIVVHAVRSRLRRTRLMNLLGLGRASEPVDLDALASPDCSPHVRAQIAQVYALLRTLPTDDRIAWTLRAVEGHDLETVARLSSCSLATVKRRISRAQKFLDDHFIHTGADTERPSRNPGQEES